MNTFPRGIHPDGKKELTEKSIIAALNAPNKVYIPLSQHIGAEAKAIVSVGDTVKMGQKIGELSGQVSASVFSSVSGSVIAIEARNTPTGKCQHVIIENDGNNDAVNFEPLTSPDKDAIIKRLEECGIVGMGGAGFPTKVKLSPKEKIEYFIINASECEPYITCDYRIILDYTEQFLRGCMLLAKTVGLDKAIIGIEENKPEAITRLNYMIGQLKLNIDVVILKVKYPQGAEKQLIYAITGRKVPVGKFPSAIGCMVDNVHTALSAYLAVTQGQPLYRRVMTITGGGIKNPQNLWVSNGTLYNDIIEHCGLSDKPAVKIINGGPMMGVAVAGGEYSSTKTTSCLLLLTEDEAFCGRPTQCINCGKCARVCPMRLMPMFIDAYSLVGDIDNAVKYGANNCIECGCCAYVCPAKRPLTQSIRLAKQKYKKGGKK